VRAPGREAEENRLRRQGDPLHAVRAAFHVGEAAEIIARGGEHHLVMFHQLRAQVASHQRCGPFHRAVEFAAGKKAVGVHLAANPQCVGDFFTRSVVEPQIGLIGACLVQNGRIEDEIGKPGARMDLCIVGPRAERFRVDGALCRQRRAECYRHAGGARNRCHDVRSW